MNYLYSCFPSWFLSWVTILYVTWPFYILKVSKLLLVLGIINALLNCSMPVGSIVYTNLISCFEKHASYAKTHELCNINLMVCNV